MGSEAKYRVIVSECAKRMLGMHIRFIAQVSKTAAEEQKRILLDAMRSLSKMPLRYPFFDESYIPRNKYHKMSVEPRYLILYQVRDRTVFVDYILDCRQDYSWLIH